eukprot:TRINITY_DN13037_c0_g1_i2.p1 TRINITY_DN13037_c0_g1~~TRINITY_DN13037_c0_g1_i2.p1  ORF type:complete len:262 (+),score=41.10 TRINITY_DN13037_c0_g1_i2:102-887(+)
MLRELVSDPSVKNQQRSAGESYHGSMPSVDLLDKYIAEMGKSQPTQKPAPKKEEEPTYMSRDAYKLLTSLSKSNAVPNPMKGSIGGIISTTKVIGGKPKNEETTTTKPPPTSEEQLIFSEHKLRPAVKQEPPVSRNDRVIQGQKHAAELLKAKKVKERPTWEHNAVEMKASPPQTVQKPRVEDHERRMPSSAESEPHPLLLYDPTDPLSFLQKRRVPRDRPEEAGDDQPRVKKTYRDIMNELKEIPDFLSGKNDRKHNYGF